MKNGYLLDISVVIDFMRGKDRVIDLIDNLEGYICCSYVILSELYEGIFRSKDEVEEKTLGYFETFDNVYGLDKSIAKEFGRIRSDLKKKGNVIEDLDIIIAATCIVHNLTLVTLNRKHFEKVERLKILGL